VLQPHHLFFPFPFLFPSFSFNIQGCAVKCRRVRTNRRRAAPTTSACSIETGEIVLRSLSRASKKIQKNLGMLYLLRMKGVTAWPGLVGKWTLVSPHLKLLPPIWHQSRHEGAKDH
jgi:hypothetical protein